jgi:hypothetical protein
MMLRALGLFLLVFSLLSLVVHFDGLGQLFGTAALCLFAIEMVTEHSANGGRPNRMRGEPLL